MVKELLLGDNPFIGVNHLSQEKARIEVKESMLENKAKVVEAAVEGGATGFTFSTHENNLELLNYFKENNPEVLRRLNYYILVPYVQSFVRKANINGTQGLIRSTLKNLLLNRSVFMDLAEAVLTLKPEKLFHVFIKNELTPYLKILPKAKIKAVLLHEIFTELIIAFKLINIVEEFDKQINKKLGVNFGLETRNFGQLTNYLSEKNYHPAFVMTPINSIGYQMAPNKLAVEAAIDEFSEKTKIIAINIMASGFLSIDEAVNYIAERKSKVFAITSASIKPPDRKSVV
jgi:hypothetical protein